MARVTGCKRDNALSQNRRHAMCVPLVPAPVRRHQSPSTDEPMCRGTSAVAGPSASRFMLHVSCGFYPRRGEGVRDSSRVGTDIVAKASAPRPPRQGLQHHDDVRPVRLPRAWLTCVRPIGSPLIVGTHPCHATAGRARPLTGSPATHGTGRRQAETTLAVPPADWKRVERNR